MKRLRRRQSMRQHVRDTLATFLKGAPGKPLIVKNIARAARESAQNPATENGSAIIDQAVDAKFEQIVRSFLRHTGDPRQLKLKLGLSLGIDDYYPLNERSKVYVLFSTLGRKAAHDNILRLLKPTNIDPRRVKKAEDLYALSKKWHGPSPEIEAMLAKVRRA